MEPTPSRDLDRPIATCIIDQDDLVHDIAPHVTAGPHHQDDPVPHDALLSQ
jgi:hypothetical protein